MNTEFEAKFLNADFNLVRKKLKKIGATQTQKLRTMRRAIIDNSNMKKKNAFIRVRDEGDKITLTYKQFDNLSIDGAKEHEVEVNNFQTTIDLLKAAGLPYRSFQESKRETWKFDEAEIVLDEWPWLNPYIEIEGISEKHVREISELLEFDWKDAVFGDVMAAYRQQYPHLNENDTIGNLLEVKFNNSLPELLKFK